ncbi:transcriptional regulator with XRE-family HTH domain [Streptomyces olivoverticillatus]|uniref:Transcriptional regulator with XRE-family HTH domain n=1 Tax=Streptomyces olivoverticillatus TaxID=66427 RepID=A0A7W7LLU9_9ACTN|nr:helix-turn-helix transcriptional regulator [Streptomyces olivoverticillatus]MBB4892063.1 transcriptional regulator with XRE-family HTH domain [Streptomyces olivoverticillatus]
MGLRTNPSQRQRRLGEELRRMREASGLSATEAGAHVSLGRAHMSHIETGRTAIPEDKLRTLARIYGCTSEPLIEALVEMSQTTGRGWWSEYKASHDAHALDLAELESSTTIYRSFQWLYVPGLLQTPDYVRAVITGGEPDASAALLDKYIEFRLRRQHVLTERGLPFHAVIHEAALHMQFVSADVMRRQIQHLVQMARLSHIQIQILPFKANVHPPRFSMPFVIFEGPVPDLNTVYVEQPITCPFISDHDRFGQFSEAFDRLSTVALEPIDAQLEPELHAKRDSLGLIRHLMYTL